MCFLITVKALPVFLTQKYPQSFCTNLLAVLNLSYSLPLTIPCKRNTIIKPQFKATECFLGQRCIHLLGQSYLIVCEGRSSVQGGMDKWTRQMRNRMQWYMSMDVRIKMKCRMCRFFRIHKLVPSRQASSCKCRGC